MSDDSRVYDGVPVAAVYDASLIALKNMDFAISEPTQAYQQISAYPKSSPWYATKQIVLDMAETGQATQLRLSGGLLQTSSEGDGPMIRQNVLAGIEAEIQKIRDAGRIVPIEAPKYTFGQVTAPPPPAPVADVELPKSNVLLEPEAKSSSLRWILQVAFWGGLVFLIGTEQGAKIIASVIDSLSGPTEVAQYNCDHIATQAKKMTLQNGFGAQFEIVRVTDLKLVSRSDDIVICTAMIGLSNGTSEHMQISVEKGDSAAEVFFQVKPL